MENKNESFEISKAFGLGVLLKLTKKNIKGIKISSNGEKFTSNVNLSKLNDAVNETIKKHNITLKNK